MNVKDSKIHSTKSDLVGMKKKVQKLTASEVAEAALLGDLALGLQVVGWLITVGAALQWVSVVPFALIYVRNRLRALVMSAVSVIMLSFLLGGVTLIFQVYLAASIGYVVGKAYMNKKKGLYVVVFSVFYGALPVAILGDLLLYVFTNARALTLKQFEVGWVGLGRFISLIGKGVQYIGQIMGYHKGSTNGGLASFGSIFNSSGYSISKFGISLTSPAKWVIIHWWFVFPLSLIVSIMLMAMVMNIFSKPIVKRVIKDFSQPNKSMLALSAEVGIGENEADESKVIRPVPLSLNEVTFFYEGQKSPALFKVSLEVNDCELIGLIGRNGSGKSTLGKVIAGVKPMLGQVIRSGEVGLGKKFGTSMVFQRPESQILGSQVEDDIVWGLSEEEVDKIDIDFMLQRVGLSGFRKRETSKLSGGELQRLAFAACLARSPSLIISDESTALLDASGRRDVMNLIAAIKSENVTVVHITHISDDLNYLDRYIQLSNGQVISEGKGLELPTATNGATSLKGSTLVVSAPQLTVQDNKNQSLPNDDGMYEVSHAHSINNQIGEKILSARNIGHVHGAKSPWEKRALIDINFDIFESDGLLVVGKNGSGKTTLAMILAGLLVPSEGEIVWYENGEKTDTVSAALVFQHARLQLINKTVYDNLMPYDKSASQADISEVLQVVDLDPGYFINREISTLSGGELRRVAIASVLIDKPKLIVLDEPLAGLDVEAARKVSSSISALREKGTATVVVSHDLEYAQALGIKVLELEDGAVFNWHDVKDLYDSVSIRDER